LLLPALSLSLAAQANGPELSVEQSTNSTYLLSWQVTTNSYIVLSAPNVGGPWEPCLNHATEAAGMCHMSITASRQCEYFRLVEGYYDDFEDGDLAGWTVGTADPAAASHLTCVVTNGHLRIHGIWSGDRRVYCLYTNLTLRNCAASLDILDWAHSPTNSMRSALLTCWETGPVTTNWQHYFSGLSETPGGKPWMSSIWAYKWFGTFGMSGGEVFLPKINPTNDYRLACSLVDGQMIVEVYDLNDLSTSLTNLTATPDDHPLAAGWPGIFANDEGSAGILDVTFDNFVVVGTTP